MTPERVREALNYDPETGSVTWAIRPVSHVHSGDEAGGPHEGYRHLTLDGKLYRTHRLIWLWMTGEWPVHEIDHANGVKDDNRWSNLRDKTHAENQHNIKTPYKNSTTGFLGVTFERSTGKFRARVTNNAKTVSAGRFDTAEEAHAAYAALKKVLHPSWVPAR